MTKTLCQLIEMILIVIFIMSLIFIFVGDPDVWDILHSRIINSQGAIR